MTKVFIDGSAGATGLRIARYEDENRDALFKGPHRKPSVRGNGGSP